MLRMGSGVKGDREESVGRKLRPRGAEEPYRAQIL